MRLSRRRVLVGLVQAAIFVGAAAAFDKKHRVPILVGGITAGALMYGQYSHARTAGLASHAEGTEEY
jgi:hypothetical protein